MDNYREQAKPIEGVLNTMWQGGFVSETLAALIDLATLMNQHGKTAEAANATAFVMNHPDVPYDTFDRAEDLWYDLELHVCPRVLTEAKEWGAIQTLRGAVEAALKIEE
jgi:hypothetical protein